jgi:SAM-dependent methyltransferase
MLAYAAYLRGHRALGISIKEGEVQRNRRLFNQLLGIPEDQLAFRVHNLYDVASLGLAFDQIICSEVLEHIRRDEDLCRAFWRILQPGGLLHLCCPNADHPDNRNHPLDLDERGGHVRPGYTAETYRRLLEPIGFELSECVGLGGPVRQWWNKAIMGAEHVLGLPGGVLCFAVSWPFLVLDSQPPRVPYSLYIRAWKRR